MRSDLKMCPGEWISPLMKDLFHQTFCPSDGHMTAVIIQAAAVVKMGSTAIPLALLKYHQVPDVSELLSQALMTPILFLRIAFCVCCFPLSSPYPFPFMLYLLDCNPQGLPYFN